MSEFSSLYNMTNHKSLCAFIFKADCTANEIFTVFTSYSVMVTVSKSRVHPTLGTARVMNLGCSLLSNVLQLERGVIYD